jgi:hypothetical protein
MRRAPFLAAIASAGCLAGYLAACTQGTTPDCSTIQCGPDLDGAVRDTSMDSPVEAAGDAGADAPEAASDAPADSPIDG